MAAEKDRNLTVIKFRMHAELNEDRTRSEGRPIYDEIEVVEFRFAGNKQTVAVFPAHDFAPGWVEDEVTGQRLRQSYAQKYNQQYLAFKSGTAQSLGGTPLEELTFLTQGKRLELKALNVHTAEALAALDGSHLKMLGMGGRELKDKATTYLDQARKLSDTTHLQEELARRDAEMAELRSQVEALQQGRTAETSRTDSAFAGFEDEDIVNWIKDADPAAATDGLGHDALIALADGILAKQGKKQGKKAA